MKSIFTIHNGELKKDHSYKTIFKRYVLSITLSCLCFHAGSVKAQCIDLGSVNGGSFANDASAGTIPFSSPTSAQLPDGSSASASATITILSGSTNYLKATNFGLTIPLNSNICGVMVEVEKSATGINIFTSVSDDEIRLVKNGTIVGSNAAVGGKWPGSDAYFTYGGSGSLWGTSLTPADVNASDFGVVVSANITGILALLPSAKVNHIRITVYFSIIVLPVQLESFSVSQKNANTLHFDWLVKDQEDVMKYTIQRSSNLSDWQNIYETNPVHDGPSASYIAELPYPNITQNFYRLRIDSRQGGVMYSDVKMISAHQSDQAFTTWNDNSTLHIQTGDTRNNNEAVIINMNGITVCKKKILPGTIQSIDISTLTAGIYIVRIGNSGSKFLKM